MSELLKIDNITVSYGAIKALKGISLSVNVGQIVTLIGANGAGKSTTLRTISGLLKPQEGKVYFEGRDISGVKPHLIVQTGISQAPEGRGIFANLSVEDNLEMGAYTRHDTEEIKKDKEEVFQLFPILKERRKQEGGTLSGGEQQMLTISRALMARPKLLLLDEPSLGLAPQIIKQIFKVISAINKKGTTILLVEQNANMALHIAHNAYVLETGKIVLSGNAQSLLTNPDVKKAYLGE
ncbi:MAG: ABC transporter ATP-binding protein [Deltaproteobacteria bacterium GWA2_38_16]|nr:MAG: ABC transporter ATP-binding protein [Deltaproteobacteria bacterium GWA2_38_16]OGQ01979.1 MAG: ABC transporter ATP-binding protein [Deltaproteobacteria bacterium RIFCSPHIGHO2_02_FULL_38_15]OGQ33674.1 MAG: ABC transporter ATP-binding protein [Deltaproteobacteria bacterium RIFCSPLOWO2_01_FULL_38_9]OGQ62852.1 MAG: ABC transporter ATP-binding protein [Deltaproteobacteria bacterium RIFCSPLOWO2_12_FULL_38_8]HBQ21512.1 ABC transporter ATP-binding protein [Deltaproteobacteria bacterium]